MEEQTQTGTTEQTEQTQTEQTTPKEERGCLLTGVLITQLLGISLVAIALIGGMCIEFSKTPIDWSFVTKIALYIVFSIVAIWAIVGTLKLKKKSAYVLMASLAIAFVFFFYVAFFSGESPFSGNLTEQQRSGVGNSIFVCAFNIMSCIVVGISLKKMK